MDEFGKFRENGLRIATTFILRGHFLKCTGGLTRHHGVKHIYDAGAVHHTQHLGHVLSLHRTITIGNGLIEQ